MRQGRVHKHPARTLLALCMGLQPLFVGAAGEPPCTPVTAVASLSPGGLPLYPLLEPSPAARPARAAVVLDGERREILVYPAGSDGAAAAAGAAAALLVTDAGSGALLWSAGRDEPALLDASLEHSPALLSGQSGIAYRGYFADAGGGVWRLDLPPGPAASWRLVKLADLGDMAGGEGSVSFPVAPDLFHAVDGDGRAFDGVVLAAVVDSGGERRVDLLLLRDYALADGTAVEPVVLSHLARIRDCARAGPPCPPAAGPGWYLDAAAPGDALAYAPLVDGGRVFLATHDSRSLDCASATALRFATVIDLETGAGLLGGERSVVLGRQRLAGPVPGDGRILLPGLGEVLRTQGLDEGLLAARGLRVRRSYWLDLLLDADDY